MKKLMKHSLQLLLLLAVARMLTGCGAVAAANAMLYGADAIIYHGDVFFCKSIREAIANNHTDDGRVIPHGEVSPQTVTGDDPVPYYTKAFAQNEVAKMMYYIGQDVEIEYSPNISNTYLYKIRLMFSGHSAYTCTVDRLFRSNKQQLCALLIAGNIIVIDGVSKKIGHIWNIDGLQNQYLNGSENPTGQYVHCDFGWNGVSNGFYDIGLLGSEYPGYSPNSFFGVKCKK